MIDKLTMYFSLAETFDIPRKFRIIFLNPIQNGDWSERNIHSLMFCPPPPYFT
jgi:hypothetical protein